MPIELCNYIDPCSKGNSLKICIDVDSLGIEVGDNYTTVINKIAQAIQSGGTQDLQQTLDNGYTATSGATTFELSLDDVWFSIFNSDTASKTSYENGVINFYDTATSGSVSLKVSYPIPNPNNVLTLPQVSGTVLVGTRGKQNLILGGNVTAVVIPHGCLTEPESIYINFSNNNDAELQNYSSTVDATNITVTFPTAPSIASTIVYWGAFV